MSPGPINRRTFGKSVASVAGIVALGGNQSAFAAPKSYDLKPLAVEDGIWMIEGETDYFTNENGGAIVNCVLIETAIGMMVVDTGSSRRYGEALRQVTTQLTGKTIAAVINTHHHPDHFFGNQVFQDVPIHALGATREAAMEDGEAFSDNMYRLLGDWMRGTEVVPPTHVIDSSRLVIGERVFTTLPLAGHTDADLCLLDEKTGTLITGDLAFHDRAPTTPNADLGIWRDSLETLSGLKASTIIPGHGPADRVGESLIQTRSYLNWLEATLREAASAGQDMMEIMDTSVPSQLLEMGAMPHEFHRSIAHLYPDIERAVMPLAK